MSTAPELSPAEAARVAAFDAAPTPPECDPERVETVARAMHEVPGQPGVYGRIPWDRLMEQHREAYRGMVRAAIAADPSPAEQAVKRVEALAEELEREAVEDLAFGHGSISSRQSAGAKRSAVTRLRAALASPAPAPQECESRGPRIGSDGKPICRLLLGHAGLHAPSADDGWGNVTWGDPR